MENWYFTFGVGTKLKGKYAKFSGTFAEARAKQINYFGTEWCAQESEESIGSMIEKYGWTEIEDYETTALEYRTYNQLFSVLKESLEDSGDAEKLAEKLYKKIAADIKDRLCNMGVRKNFHLEFTTFDVRISLGKVLNELIV